MITLEQITSCFDNDSLNMCKSLQPLEPDDIVQIFNFIQSKPRINRLDLSRLKLNDSLAEALAFELSKNTQLEILNLNKTELSDEGIMCIALRMKNIKNLYLLNNSFTVRGVNALVTATNNNNPLERLGLSKNRLDDEAAKALARSKVRTLLLTDNLIGDEGARALLNAENIENISLEGNLLTDAFIEEQTPQCAKSNVKVQFIPSTIPSQNTERSPVNASSSPLSSNLDFAFTIFQAGVSVGLLAFVLLSAFFFTPPIVTGLLAVEYLGIATAVAGLGLFAYRAFEDENGDYEPSTLAP